MNKQQEFRKQTEEAKIEAFSLMCRKVAELEKENAELKCECRRCVYSDCPCILSDYGKDRNGICDHFKDVFDEIVELKEENAELRSRDCWKSCEYANSKAELIGQHIKDVQNLTKAKEILKKYHYECPAKYSFEDIDDMAEQFLKDNA